MESKITAENIIKGMGTGNDVEISTYLRSLSLDELKALCKEYGWKPGRDRNYLGAAFRGLRENVMLWVRRY